MKLTCALCGRGMTQAAFTIGPLAVGPKCGIKAGFTQMARKKAGAVRVVGQTRARRVQDDSQIELALEVVA